MARQEIDLNPITAFLHNGTTPPESAGVVRGNAFYPGKKSERAVSSRVEIETSTPGGTVIQIVRTPEDVRDALENGREPQRRSTLRRAMRVFSSAH